MKIEINENSFVIFDLDDTLYPEIQFLKSGFNAIDLSLKKITHVDLSELMFEKYSNNINAFEWAIGAFNLAKYNIDTNYLLKIYREHYPNIRLNKGAKELLIALEQKKIKMGLLTDGRSTTQRNKISALKIHNFFDDIIISEEFGSEKPSYKNYNFFVAKYPSKQFVYIGDNVNKDFIVPDALGWKSYCLLDAGSNIHVQNLKNLPKSVECFSDFSDFDVYKTNIFSN